MIIFGLYFGIFDREKLAEIVTGHEVLISSYGPQVGTGKEEELLDAPPVP